MSNLNKKSNSGLNIDTIVGFCKKNVKYISAGVLTVALIVILASSAVNGKKDDNEPKNQEEVQPSESGKEDSKDNTDDSKEDSKEDLEEVVNESENQGKIEKLFRTYYNSYAAGNVDKLKKITKNLSAMEKDYIKMMNKHVDSYEDIKCTVEDGSKEGSFIVSAVYNMKFAGTDEALPGMNVFYVQTNEDGKLYINNKYSSFNRELEEQKMNKKILKLIKDFEGGDTVQKLEEDVQEEYDKIIEGNKALKKKVSKVAKAITKWKDTYVASAADDKEDKKSKEDKKEKESKDKQEEQNQTEQQQESQETQQEETQENTDDGSSEDGESGGVNYVPEGTVLTANNVYNVRTSMSVSSEIVGSTAVGDSIKVILSYAEGWTKVEWNEKTGYIRTDLLLKN